MDFARELVDLYALGNPRYLNKQVLTRDIYQLLAEFDLEPLTPLFIKAIRKKGNNEEEIQKIKDVDDFEHLIETIQNKLLIYSSEDIPKYDLWRLDNFALVDHFAGLDDRVIDYYIDILSHQ